MEETSRKKAQKNKMMIIGAAAIVLIILAFGGFYFMNSKKTNTTPTSTDQTQNVKTLKAEDIGLTLSPKNDGKVITMEVTKLDGVSSIEYDVSYDAYVTDQGENTVTPRGVVGSPIEVKAGETIKRDIDLGTCSRNVCKYDKVVSEVKFTIKVNYKDGSVGSVEKSILIPGTDTSLDKTGNTSSGSSKSSGGDY